MSKILTALRNFLNDQFGGVLKQGQHARTPRPECCALELVCAYKGLAWSDNPRHAGVLDLRQLNDVTVPNAVRTEHLLPVLAAYYGSYEWSTERMRWTCEQLVVRLTRDVFPGMITRRWPSKAVAAHDLASVTDVATAWKALRLLDYPVSNYVSQLLVVARKLVIARKLVVGRKQRVPFINLFADLVFVAASWCFCEKLPQREALYAQICREFLAAAGESDEQVASYNIETGENNA